MDSKFSILGAKHFISNIGIISGMCNDNNTFFVFMRQFGKKIKHSAFSFRIKVILAVKIPGFTK